MPDIKRQFNDVVRGDVFDEALLENVHPDDWVNPKAAARYNLVVLGGGTAGEVAAGIAGSLGARVALIEKGLMGGDCLVTGCIPSKSVIHSGRILADIRRSERFGIKITEEPVVDFALVMERMRRTRARLSTGDSARRFREEFGVDVFLGEGRFTGPESAQAAGQTLNFKRAIIATGSRPEIPSIEGLLEAGFHTSETIFAVDALPRRLAILGAGPIGCELSQAFARLGSEVYLLDLAPRILAREESDAVAIVARALIDDGVVPVLEATVERIEAGADEKLVFFNQDGEEELLMVDEILVAAGRVPNVAGLGLEAAGVKYDAKIGVLVDDYLKTSNDRIYATGDVCLPEKFTHAADASSIEAVENALLGRRRKKSSLVIPHCTYTDPEIAHVGLYPADVERMGLAARSYTVDLAHVDRAVIDGEDSGLVRLTAKKGNGQIIGATVVSRRAGDLIAEITALMYARVSIRKLSRIVHPFPTLSESIRMAGDEYQKSRLTPVLRTLSGLYFRARRRF